MALTYRDGVSIGEIIIYTWAVAVAIFLAMRHGFRKSSGWLYLIIFCIARILGPAMQLATIKNPTNTSLYTGYAILNNVGLSPLMLAALGFLSRLLDSIRANHDTKLHPLFLNVIKLIILVGLILAIIGGINASDDYTKAVKAGSTTAYHPGSLSKAGNALFIVSYVALVALTVALSFSTPHAATGEKRLLYAVAIALPFLLIRLIYSCLSTFTTDPKFNLLTGSITVLLCMSLLMEICVVIAFEIMGLSLKKVVKVEGRARAQHRATSRQVNSSDSSEPLQKRGNGNMALNIAKKTIIGRVVMACLPSEKYDVELQNQEHIAK